MKNVMMMCAIACVVMLASCGGTQEPATNGRVVVTMSGGQALGYAVKSGYMAQGSVGLVLIVGAVALTIAKGRDLLGKWADGIVFYLALMALVVGGLSLVLMKPLNIRGDNRLELSPSHDVNTEWDRLYESNRMISAPYRNPAK